MHGRYDKYMSLNVSWGNIYQECANTQFQKVGIRALIPISESSWTDKKKYYNFHKGHDHNTNDCIQLKDAIEGLIKRGRLYEYVKGGNQE